MDIASTVVLLFTFTYTAKFPIGEHICKERLIVALSIRHVPINSAPYVFRIGYIDLYRKAPIRNIKKRYFFDILTLTAVGYYRLGERIVFTNDMPFAFYARRVWARGPR